MIKMIKMIMFELDPDPDAPITSHCITCGEQIGPLDDDATIGELDDLANAHVAQAHTEPDPEG